MTSLFRYPGGKRKLSKKIISLLAQNITNNEKYTYVEPFFGGGSIGLDFIDKYSDNISYIILNDKDAGIAILWSNIINNPEKLKDKIQNFTPTVESFCQFKQDLIDGYKTADLGFKKLAIHQMSYSGLGVKSGGPLGGMSQKSKYKIDCRWSPDSLCRKIDKAHKIFQLKPVLYEKCFSSSFESIFNWIQFLQNAILYLDPPYYVKGNDLYQCGFTADDHIRLAKILQNTQHSWVLSYDDCKEIRKLYSWAKIEKVNVTYNITALKSKSTGKRTSRTKTELLITCQNK